MFISHRPTAPFGYRPTFHSHFLSSPELLQLFRGDGEDENEDSGNTKEPKKDSITATDIAEQPVTYRVGRGLVTMTNENYAFSVDLPGVKANDIHIQQQDDTLELSAERKFGDKVLSKFSQKFEIDKAIDLSNIDARLIDGVLTVTFPKKEAPAEPNAESLDVTIAAAAPPAQGANEENVFWSMDVPGVKHSDLTLKYQKESIIIQGERKSRDGSVSKIHRVLSLNDKLVDPSILEAFLMDGVLTIKARRRAVPPPKTIPVSTAAKEDKSPKKIKDAEEKKDEEIVVEDVDDAEE
jgi:HSP20 family molecular chaperone IbpA